MSAKVQAVVSELPPRVGGVADYAARLAEHWPENALTAWRVAAGAEEAALTRPDWTVEAVPEDASCRGWPDTGTLLVHYTQYGYAGGGIPWRLVAGLRRWRAGGRSPELAANRTQGRRLVVFFHETWLTGPFWRRRGVVAPAARWCARALAGAADVVVTNCARHASQLSDVCAVTVLPVPSNIGRFQARPAEGGKERRTFRVVVFGLPETRLRTLRAHRGFLSWLRDSGGLGELVLLGAGGEADRFTLEGAGLAAELAGEAVRRAGATTEAGVSAELSGADLGLTAYASDETGKSGTLAALFTHGCPVGCAGHDAGGLAFNLSLGAGGAPRDWTVFLDADERGRRAARVAAYAAESLNWHTHAARLSELTTSTQKLATGS